MGSEWDSKILSQETYIVPGIIKFVVWTRRTWGPGPLWFFHRLRPKRRIPSEMQIGCIETGGEGWDTTGSDKLQQQ